MDKYKYFFGCLHTVGGAAMKKLLMQYGSEYDIYYASDESIENSENDAAASWQVRGAL